jgi:hypothetical protein
MTARAFRAPGTRIPLRPSDLDRSLRFYRDARYPIWTGPACSSSLQLGAQNWPL